MIPNRKDLRKLQKLNLMVERVGDFYSTLSLQTKEHLLDDYNGETELHLLRFNRNVSDAIRLASTQIPRVRKKKTVSKYFAVAGFWKDNGEPFSGLIVKEFDDIIEGEDDSIFYYGLSEDAIKEAIKQGKDTIFDFVITHYKKTAL